MIYGTFLILHGAACVAGQAENFKENAVGNFVDRNGVELHRLTGYFRVKLKVKEVGGCNKLHVTRN